MTRFKIGQKLLALLLAVSLGPLVVVTLFLVNSAQHKLRTDAVNQQKQAAINAADRVDTFLGDKTDILIFQSQTSAARQFDIPNTNLNLAALVKQDRDIQRVSLVDKTGMERVAVDQNGLIAKHENVSSSDPFKSATFLAGKEYIGPVQYVNGKPHVVIAVPLIRFTEQQDLTHLSTAEFGTYRSADDIQGVMIADFSLANLWQSVLATKIGSDGYAYVVDDKGNLIAHPDSAFLSSHRDVSRVHEVAEFLASQNSADIGRSEKGVPVLASYKAITRSSWGVIVEEPTASVFASVNSIYRIGVGIMIGVAIVAIVCSLLFRRQLLVPIQLIAAGAMRIGRGDFRYKIPVRTNDELGDLAHSFNSMGGSLEAFVHDLQKRNASLSEERRKQSSILESVSDGIIAINKKGEIVLINAPAAALIGKKPADLTGASFREHFILMVNERPFALNVTRAGIYHYDDLVLPYADKLSYLELVVAVVEDMQDIAAIITVHDLTPGRELEVMKLDFVAIAAHELRTPLTVVRGYLDLVNSSPEISRLTVMNLEYLQRAQSGVSQLSGLINNILNVSRIERGTLHVNLTKVDLGEILARAVVQQRVSAVLKQQHLGYAPPKEQTFVAADESAINEVVTNLINNAIKYTPEGGHISVAAERVGDFVRVEVGDDGQGIPDGAKANLFTKFYRVENSMTTGNRGTGLGLFISKSIISLHHGEIGVVSKLGEGSTFYFTLPLYDERTQHNVNKESEELDDIHGWFPKRTNR
ncbi:MAG TPA: ATP-binding protein [Bacillota bacterium]|nr:ATP-binding protein [Bacillota bacterium]